MAKKDSGEVTRRVSYYIVPCTCAHAFQDKEYGRGMRLHNRAGKSGADPKARCTICTATKNAPAK